MEYFYVGKKNSNETVISGQGGLLEQRLTHRKRVNLWITEQIPVSDPALRVWQNAPCILDLSRTGAFVAGSPAKLHEEIALEFVLPNRLQPIQVKGKVVRAVVTKNSSMQTYLAKPETLPSGMGIQFTNISSLDQQALDSFLDSEITHEKITTAIPLQPSAHLFADEEIDHFLQGNLSSSV